MDEEIQSRKSLVQNNDGYANRDGEELKQLESTSIKEEGLFCVEWCVVTSVSIGASL